MQQYYKKKELRKCNNIIVKKPPKMQQMAHPASVGVGRRLVLVLIQRVRLYFSQHAALPFSTEFRLGQVLEIVREARSVRVQARTVRVHGVKEGVHGQRGLSLRGVTA